jgi:hypothetical protein
MAQEHTGAAGPRTGTVDGEDVPCSVPPRRLDHPDPAVLITGDCLESDLMRGQYAIHAPESGCPPRDGDRRPPAQRHRDAGQGDQLREGEPRLVAYRHWMPVRVDSEAIRPVGMVVGAYYVPRRRRRP